jgi:hypothetical protein
MPKRKNRSQTREVHPGRTAETEDHTLRTYQVGALPIVNRILDRMGIAPVLRQHFSGERKGQSITTATGLLLMLRNIVVVSVAAGGWAILAEWLAGSARG